MSEDQNPGWIARHRKPLMGAALVLSLVGAGRLILGGPDKKTDIQIVEKTPEFSINTITNLTITLLMTKDVKSLDKAELRKVANYLGEIAQTLPPESRD